MSTQGRQKTRKRQSNATKQLILSSSKLLTVVPLYNMTVSKLKPLPQKVRRKGF